MLKSQHRTEPSTWMLQPSVAIASPGLWASRDEPPAFKLQDWGPRPGRDSGTWRRGEAPSGDLQGQLWVCLSEGGSNSFPGSAHSRASMELRWPVGLGVDPLSGMRQDSR